MRHRGKKDKKIFPSMVGATGIEPVTPAVSRQCSTAELRTQYLINYSKIKEKNEQITKASAKSCLIDASVCITKSNSSLKNSEPFSSSWLKSAAYFLADAICLLNLERPSPTHSLQSIRKFNTNKFHQSISTLIEIIGLERATTSLLSRMCKSTIGFSDMVEKNGNSKIIQRKYEYLTEKSLLSDCYFYFGYINRNNFIKIKNDISIEK